MTGISIIIPSFNNGPKSSEDGFDFITRCVESLKRCAVLDGTEILIYDDGSNDGSQDTIAAFDGVRAWRNEGPPIGISRASNFLLDRASHRIYMRFDGDAEMKTVGFDAILVDLFERYEEFSVIGPIQLNWLGKVHAFGDELYGDRGYRHLHKGRPLAELQTMPDLTMVDHTMGACYAARRREVEIIGGYNEELYRCDSIDLSIRLLMVGKRIAVTPRFMFQHHHGRRGRRDCPADRIQNIDADRAWIRAHYGFDWRDANADPGIDKLRARYAASPFGTYLNVRGGVLV